MNEEKHSEIQYTGVEGRYWNENVSARPNGLREKAETAIPGPTRKKKEICQQSGGVGRGYKYVPMWYDNRE